MAARAFLKDAAHPIGGCPHNNDGLLQQGVIGLCKLQPYRP